MLLILPLLIPFGVAVASLLAWRQLRFQRWVGIGGMFLLLLAAASLLGAVSRHGIQTVQIGGWPAPHGITLVADHFAALMVMTAALVATAVAVYSAVDLDRPRQVFAYYPLLHTLLMGVCGAFLTGDLFNLYVWFEVMLISSFVLLALGSQRTQLEGALKYVTLNLVSSFLFLTAVGLLYGAVGTLNMADAAGKLASLETSSLVTTLAILFLMAFGIKAAIFPLFFWLPASYHTPPAAISAVFAGLLTKVGVYALIRVFTLLFTPDIVPTRSLFLVLSCLTMVTGVLGAVSQTNIRRILSFHIISQIGYMIMGLALFTPFAIAAAIYFMIHNMIAKSSLFLVSGIVYQLRKSYELKALGGLYHGVPSLAVLFAIPALALAGAPPLSGFIAKLSLIRAGLEIGQYVVVAVAIFVSLLTLYSMIKIWNGVFWEPEPQRPPHETRTAGEHPPGQLSVRELRILVTPVAVLAAITVAIGVAAGPVFPLMQQAGHELLNRSEYIEAVMKRK